MTTAPEGIEFPEPLLDGEKRIDPAAHPNMTTVNDFLELTEAVTR